MTNIYGIEDIEKIFKEIETLSEYEKERLIFHLIGKSNNSPERILQVIKIIKNTK